MRLMIACRAIDNMAGGVERQALALANELSKRGHEVSLFTLDHKEAQAFYPIEPSVHWYKLGIGNPGRRASWTMRFQRMKRIRQIMREFKPDVCLAFQDGMFISLRPYTIGMGIPIVAAERESPYRFDYIKAGKYRQIIYQAMRFAPYITVQCESYPAAYPTWLQPKIRVIPNAIVQSKTFAAPEGEEGQSKILLCVGRLGYQKNQLLLLDAFARLAPLFPDWKLVFVGEGEGRKDIEAKINSLGLTEKVSLMGAVKNVQEWYVKSHALCIPSLWEGFPNVLGEALAHGLPAVGFDGCGGVKDLITHGKSGFLASGTDDVNALYDALNDMMKNDARRKELGNYAVVSVQQYAPDKVYDLWEAFLEMAKRK